MRPFVLHAHFYQPERLNPWTDTLDPEPSAAPDRDWNARILRECYRPNGSARIYDEHGRIERIVNNYERLSFDFGPTLLSWMEHAAPRAYSRVLDGDWRSVVRTGHGNALAQAYNHLILPLASARDRRTQILWGLADFRARFNREAEGMWLPETAADVDTIDALIDAGVRFTVLAPHQVVGARETDRPYRMRHSDGSGRSIAVFLYDGDLAQSLAFDPAAARSGVLVERLAEAGGTGLVSAALDGETFGHHHRFGELGLAYALFHEAESRGLVPTSYAAVLADSPPVDEALLVPGEGTAWSCAHGVGRWYRDCGCSTGGESGWNQRWRTPLRDALDVVSAAAAEAYEVRGGELLKDPWAARDDYIGVRLGQQTPEEFLDRHGLRQLSEAGKIHARTLLEAQRHAMLMYTSCGWFFNDVAGLETLYVLRSAARVLDLLHDAGISTPEDPVLEHLGEARSNRHGVGTAADLWRTRVREAEVTPRRLAAHTALVGLLRPLPRTGGHSGFEVEIADERSDTRGRLALGTARVTVRAIATGHEGRFGVAALYLGGLDFHGVVGPDPGPAAFAAAADRLWAGFGEASVAGLVRQVSELLDGMEFGFEQLLPVSRTDVARMVFADLTERFAEQFARLYHDHHRLLQTLTAAGFDLPRELRTAAELTLSGQVERQLARAAREGRPPGSNRSPVKGEAQAALDAVARTATLARRQGYELDAGGSVVLVSAALESAVRDALADPGPSGPDLVARWLAVARDLGITPDLIEAQDVVYEAGVKARGGRGSLEVREVITRLAELLGFASGL
jgi:alpha-amylase/alpha-mannosidase (GH57 family)